MKSLFLLLALIATVPDFQTAVLRITGAGSAEDLDESTLERFRALSQHPLELNGASRSRLLASGLLTAFQAASLLEYRQSTGDILSFTELSLVDGFPPDFVDALRLFARLESSSPPGKRPSRKLHANLMLRAAAREQDGLSSAYGGKLKATLGQTYELNWAGRTAYSGGQVFPGTVSAAAYGRKNLGKIVLGHFNARFGQGLAQWSGFSLQPYGSVNSLRRSGTGISATGSFSPEHCGVAADFDLGRWNVAAAWSVPDKLPMAHVCYVSKTVTAGATVTGKALGVDWRIGVPNVSIYGELAWKSGLQAIAGAMWVPSYGKKVAAVCRYIDGVPEVIAGAGSYTFDAVAALSSGQFRAIVKYAPAIDSGPLKITPALRLAARHKDEWRLESRGELQFDYAGWMLRSRIDLVHCNEYSWLVNAEAARTAGPVIAYVRWTLFRVDNWDDRIYVYERDIPGSFNVPAYYGKGWSISLTGSWKPSPRHAFHYRLCYLSYPWTTTPKPSKLEVKLQYQLSL